MLLGNEMPEFVALTVNHAPCCSPFKNSLVISSANSLINGCQESKFCSNLSDNTLYTCRKHHCMSHLIQSATSVSNRHRPLDYKVL